MSGALFGKALLVTAWGIYMTNMGARNTSLCRRPFIQMFRALRWMPIFSTRPDVAWCTSTAFVGTHFLIRRSGGGGGGGGVIPRLLSFVTRVMAITQLAHLHTSIPASGAPPGQAPAECFPGGSSSKGLTSPRRVSFASSATVLGDAPPLVDSPDIILHEPLRPEGTIYGYWGCDDGYARPHRPTSAGVSTVLVAT